MRLTRSALQLKQISGHLWIQTCSLSVTSNKKRHGTGDFKENVYSKTNKRVLLKYAAGLAGISVGIGAYKLWNASDKSVLAAEPIVGARVADLPTYSMKEISSHFSKESGIWVIYKNGVYDISQFIDKHPGGDKIMMAAGGSVEPFWMMYGVHKQDHILELLEEYRIGNVDEDEVDEFDTTGDDPYAKDPRRHPVLRPCSLKPYNAEPSPEILVDSFITPQ